MKFGYTIVYVADVVETINFYHRAFGLAIRFIHESNQYGELDTGGTTLAFAVHELASSNLPIEYQRSDSGKAPFGIELGFTTADVPGAFARAIAAGATAIAEPKQKPWGQVVAYVRAIEGTLIEICTPMGE